ncbi:MAG: response regulator [Candidatus Woesearchaeota archaeon]|nr:response regulator [Candidatus Woesearchaeota archaeon]
MKTILVIDDEPTVRTLAKHILQSKGYNTIEAATGSEAIQAVFDNLGGIDGVVSDTQLQKHEEDVLGYYLWEIIGPYCGNNVVATSGTMSNKHRAAWKRVGAKAILEKPYSIQDLDEALQRFD